MSSKIKVIIFFICLLFSTGDFVFNNFVFKNNTWDDLTTFKGDEIGYVMSAESFFNGGDHYFYRTDQRAFTSNFIEEGDYDLGMYYAFRTPGYSFVYLPLRLFFSLENTLIAILFLQVFLISITKYIICITIYKFCEKSVVSLICGLILTNLFLFISYYNSCFLTEPLSIFFLVISFWTLSKSEIKSIWWGYLLGGFFLLIAALLRPFLFAVFPIYLKPFFRKRYCIFLYQLLFLLEGGLFGTIRKLES